MKPYIRILTIILMLVGTYGILWPLPGFLLPEEQGERYFQIIWNLPKDDKSAGAALPFLWFFFTLPIGVLLIVMSLITYLITRQKDPEERNAP